MAQDTEAIGTVVRASALIAVPWANGGGQTRVIADRPEFRLSLATIDAEGPFSAFPGLIRHFALVAGHVNLSPVALSLDPSSLPVTFEGALAVFARPYGGPALALNLMVPAQCPPLQLDRVDGGDCVDAVAVFACAPITVDGVALAAHDTLFPSRPVRLSGRALVMR